jgi:hypothetical protein
VVFAIPANFQRSYTVILLRVFISSVLCRKKYMAIVIGRFSVLGNVYSSAYVSEGQSKNNKFTDNVTVSSQQRDIPMICMVELDVNPNVAAANTIVYFDRITMSI